MKLKITQQQLDKINISLYRNLKSGDRISYHTFRWYNVTLPNILTDDIYYDIVNYFDKHNIKSNIYFTVE